MNADPPPIRPPERPAAHVWPALPLAALIAGGVALALVAGLLHWSGAYGWTLFVVLPLVQGLLCGLVARGMGTGVLSTALASAALLAVGLLVFAIEGVICIAMAAPLWVPALLVGALIGGAAGARSPGRRARMWWIIGVTLLGPLLAGAESRLAPAAPLLRVDSAVTVDAPPGAVWRQVIAFSALPKPRELLFRAGVAYPVRAEIDGRGVGAVRRCVFSTGAFVEPITAWDEPRRLAFDVIESPPPMTELSPYPSLHTPHAHGGYFVARRGRFDLIPLDGGSRTRLVGTTWYTHDVWPQTYWRLWSDHIIHRIHLHVLENIKRRAEQPRVAG